MADFMIRFFFCNVFLSGIILVLLLIKRICKNSLSGRMQYHLWFLLLGLLIVPFLPFRPIEFWQIYDWIGNLKNSTYTNTENVMEKTLDANLNAAANLANDFAISVDSALPSFIGSALFWIWLAGILAMMVLTIQSSLRLHTVKQSALPLQNSDVRKLYQRCLHEVGITKELPIYSTAFLKSPVMTGVLKPCIYLPIHLISGYAVCKTSNSTLQMLKTSNSENERDSCQIGTAKHTLTSANHCKHEDGQLADSKCSCCSDLRYILLHELQHYKHKDALVGYLMSIAQIVYWFHPLVWYALKEMRNDREIACDAAVLDMLEEDDYKDYGNTLIRFAEKISLMPFSFTAGLGGNKSQIKQRIIHIATYQKSTFLKKLKGTMVFILIATALLGAAPTVSTYAADKQHYQWESASENIFNTDFSSYFGEYEGSFVLYDLEHDHWQIHNMEHALLRVSPNSTYKIYDALFGLEEGIITSENSFLAWNGETYPFEAWNTDQTLFSAMDASVNWYFEEIDKQLGNSGISDYIQEIAYGNETISRKFPAYWMEASLKISVIEQVELLMKLYYNDFDFAPENVQAVKDAIRLSASEAGTLYGKTGTGRVDGQDVNGWFVGYIETTDNVYFFATNICADANATGSKAAEIALDILFDMRVYIKEEITFT